MSRQLSGLQAWVIQRLSAVYIGLFLIIAGIILLVKGAPSSYTSWHALWSSPGPNLAMLVFVFALLVHAWVGMRDVILDYVHPDAIRFILLSLFALGLLASGLWAARILFNLMG